MTLKQIDAVLVFWFGTDVSTPQQAAAVAQRWFTRDAAFDDEIRAKFGDLVERAIEGELGPEWSSTPDARLAQILLLDQFPRNLHRGSSRAFDGDPRARSIALDTIDRGDDQALPPQRRVFLYMPLEHAEDLATQERCVALFEALAAQVPAASREPYDNYAGYARRHRDVIARYGRFPHRNAVLGRATSADEQAYLDAGGGF